MNFQSVSVGEKLTGDGYTDTGGTPSVGLSQALDFVDLSLGRFVKELEHEQLLDSTLIIVGAKPGQSPPCRRMPLPRGSKRSTARYPYGADRIEPATGRRNRDTSRDEPASSAFDSARPGPAGEGSRCGPPRRNARPSGH